jgi:hypothetical protein
MTRAEAWLDAIASDHGVGGAIPEWARALIAQSGATTSPTSLVHAGRSTYRAFELNVVSPDDHIFFSVGKHPRAFPFPISDP